MRKFMMAAIAAATAVVVAGAPALADAQDRGDCWSNRACGGKRLGNYQHWHNCKKAGGKSWESTIDGTCRS